MNTPKNFNEFINADMFYSKEFKNSDGTAARYKRNGKTKTWKKTPGKFQIPVKRGLKEFGYIDNDNFDRFTI